LLRFLLWFEFICKNRRNGGFLRVGAVYIKLNVMKKNLIKIKNVFYEFLMKNGDKLVVM